MKKLIFFKNLKLRGWVIIFLICVVYIGLNFAFNFNIWEHVWHRDTSTELSIIGESPIYEFVAEEVKKNILNFNNPFQKTNAVLYPFGWDFSLDDVAPINGFYFVLLRPFLSIHQSFMLIVLLSVFVSNITMYVLLRLLGMNKKTAFLFGLVFGFSPFVALRIGGHPTYVAFYLFTLPAIFLTLLIKSKDIYHKSCYAVLLGCSFVVVLLTNLYFAVMMFIMVALLAGFSILYNRRDFILFLKKNYAFGFLTAGASALLLAPWLIQIYRRSLFNPYTTPPPGWVDSIAFSADLFNIVLPSYLSPLYLPVLSLFYKCLIYYRPLFESITYPGLIITTIFLLFYWYRKYFSKFVHVLFFTAASFLVLTLGPFLHILGRNTHVPLPYALINFIPYLQMARSPGRFIVPFIFLMSLCGAFFLNYLFEKKYAKKARILFIVVLAVFLLDQSYVAQKQTTVYVPSNLYKYPKVHNYRGPLLEVPFTIRDGLENFGSFNSVWSFRKRSRFNAKFSSFGVYAGRINSETFSFYRRNALLRPLADILEGKITSPETLTAKFDPEKSRQVLDFFSVSYATLDKSEAYSPLVESMYEQLGFREILRQDSYALYHRSKNAIVFDTAFLGVDEEGILLERGWSIKEEEGRWATGKIANVLFRPKRAHRHMVYFNAASPLIDKQKVAVYVNGKFVGKVVLSRIFSSHKLAVPFRLRKGVTLVTFSFEKSFVPAKQLKNNQDRRALSVFFTKIQLLPLSENLNDSVQR